jgi:hypothetical protein
MCITENQKSVLSSKKAAELLNLSNLKKQIPNEAFEKNLLSNCLINENYFNIKKMQSINLK